MITVDIAVLKKIENQTFILLIKRGNEPFKNTWALPGGFVEMDENLIQAAERELLEETAISGIELKQFYTYGELNRDPRGRTVSVIYYGFTNQNNTTPIAGDDAADAKWFLISNLPLLAFDHEKIINELNNFLQLV
jgi:8-oxo-dGTP diphosphatase